MYQDFADATERGQTAVRISRLRALMQKRSIDAYLVPRADEHQGEYVPPSADRLRWLTGFSGSAGLAVIDRSRAALFVDGRYTVQVRHEIDLDLFDIAQVPDQKVTDWLKTALPAGSVIGFDPWLHTWSWLDGFEASLKQQAMTAKAVPRNLVDIVWTDRPPAPTAPIVVQPLKYAGVAAADKLAAIQKQLTADRQSAVVLTLPDSICWLLNIRGRDVAHNPVALAFAVVPAEGRAELFVDPAKLSDEVRAHLDPVATISDCDALSTTLKALASAATTTAIAPATPKRSAKTGATASSRPAVDGRPRIRLDADTAAVAIARMLGASAVRGGDPCIAPKARKCAAEIKGARAAHLRDGIAMARFLAWLDAEGPSGQPVSTLDEIGAVRQLEQFRRASNLLRDISFPTISGSGANGAIVHYRVTEATNRRLRAGELFLIDSGAQYADGTTDITRTVAIGTPTDAMRSRYTAVLAGHIAISTARFPAGTRGIELDALARRPLWELGLDYDHGTGHGVGSYLSVHEGPAGISKRAMVALEPGMILSNEPGYYARDAYGIRIENLVLVMPPKMPAGGERQMLGFETLTLAPYDRRLIVTDVLSPADRAWVDTYHARVHAEVGARLEGARDAATSAWLAKATAPLQ